MSAQISYPDLEERIKFVIKHHGSKIQGEEYRLEQVAHRLCVMFQDLTTVLAVLRHSDNEVESTIEITVR